MAGCFGSDHYDRYLESLVDAHCDGTTTVDSRDLEALEEAAEQRDAMLEMLKAIVAHHDELVADYQQEKAEKLPMTTTALTKAKIRALGPHAEAARALIAKVEGK